MSDKVVAEIDCPVCGHCAKFVLSKEATLESLNDINWKQKVKEAFNRLESRLGDQFDQFNEYSPYKLINEIKKELNL